MPPLTPPESRLELPIDHFRLLGVGPGAEPQSVLHTLQSRLNRPPDQGFSQDTLDARADLLRASADLLSDGPRRAAYESALTALAGHGDEVMPALDVPPTKEVAGLLLLLEADQSLECFELVCRALQPPQAPVLGSSRESDLTLLAGLSCLKATEELHQQRRYEAAARTLQRGLELLQRMGQAPDLRERIIRELDRLAPYRVLDLLSRDLMATEERREGLNLLEQLVQRRGGLEGNGDPDFGSEEFQSFFRQIRSFLTVQEQIDLFSRWGEAGSGAADFLAATALTASGFARRKPERIAAARERLQASGRSGIEPLLANLALLLGEVDTARICFEQGAGAELKEWAARQTSDPLGQICAYCRDWLARDVLPGYRDLDADPDLEAYFGDRDVVAFVEREDRRSGRVYGGVPQDAPSGTAESFSGGSAFSFDDSLFGSASWETSGFSTTSFSSSAFTETHDDDPEQDDDDVPISWRWPSWKLPRPDLSAGSFLNRIPFPWLLAGGVGLVVLAVLGVWLARPRQPATVSPTDSHQKRSAPARPPAPVRQSAPTPGTAPGATSARSTASAYPLKSAEPTEAELRALLEAWLAAKAAVLAGGSPSQPLASLARPAAVERLEAERNEDRSRGESQKIDVKVRRVSISERTPQRIALTAELGYSDRRLDASGKVLERTPSVTLRNLYVFGRQDGSWRLVASRPAD